MDKGSLATITPNDFSTLRTSDLPVAQLRSLSREIPQLRPNGLHAECADLIRDDCKSIPPLEWKISNTLVPYPQALAEMEAYVTQMHANKAAEQIWLLEHPPLYTAGTSAKSADLLEARFPVYPAGRGGQYTYHGPGQRVGYVMLDLQQRMNGQPDLRRFVWLLEEWIIRTVAVFGVAGERRAGRVGIWVARTDGSGNDDKIAALGIRLRKWISYHGISINVNPDLSHYSGIIPCGIRQHGVTSLAALGKQVTMAELDAELQRQFLALDFVA